MKKGKGKEFLQHLKDMIELHQIVMSAPPGVESSPGEGNVGIGGRKDEHSKRIKR